MYQINEFNNSALGQSLANEKRDAADGKILTRVTIVAVIFMFIAFKSAIGG